MPELTATNPVTEVPAAPSTVALAYFEAQLSLETDCWDVHEALSQPDAGFVLFDVRSPDLFAADHIPGASNLPHRRINERNLAPYPDDVLFVVYCAGPHCNGADNGAVPRAGPVVVSRAAGALRPGAQRRWSVSGSATPSK